MSDQRRTFTPALLLAFSACGLFVPGCGPQRPAVAEQGEGTQIGSEKGPAAPTPRPAVEEQGEGSSPDIGKGMTVLFLVDRSLSVPPEPAPDDRTIDLRWLRVKRFINEAVEKRGPGHERDKAGVIVFGKRPRLMVAPTEAKRLDLDPALSFESDGSATDIGAAIKLALATFPEKGTKRIVLISDGNENLGDAVAQARAAKEQGVEIDVVPLAAAVGKENEVLVESVQVPAAKAERKEPIRVLLRNHNPNPVIGELTLRQIVEGVARPVGPRQGKVRLAPGLSSFKFDQPLGAAKGESYTYEAEFVPEGVLVNAEKGELKPLVGDRPYNNRATTHVIARGRRRVLLLEAVAGNHTSLVREMRARKIDMTVLRTEDLPNAKDRLTVFLSNFDSVVLADVPADALSEDQQEVIRGNTHEQGCGLVVIGGPDSFGAGGWQNTPIEKALPVESEIKALKVQGKGGLVLIMHASEMADGNFWQKKIAKLAIEKLSNIDEFGLLYYDEGAMKWHIPLQEIGDKREFLMHQVDKMVPGDMPDFDPGLKMAHQALTEKDRDLSVRHVIIISHGDPAQTDANILGQMKRDKVTVSTVGVATHGAPQDQQMARIAQSTGGRYHKVANPNMLPAVYIKETRLVSQSFVYEKKFSPKATPLPGGPTENLAAVPPLYGFVRTTPKQSPLVGIPIESPEFNGQVFPVLAYWQYGLGRSVAFTSDARTNPPGKGFWDKDWAGSDMYVKFWEQVITWALRPSESKNFVMTVEQRDGKVKVTLSARDEHEEPIKGLALRGFATPLSVTQDGPALKFKEPQAGVYEAEFVPEAGGDYLVAVQATRKVKGRAGKEVEVERGFASARAAVTTPPPPELREFESNPRLMERLRELTGGKTYEDSAAAMEKAARSGDVFRPVAAKP